MVSKTEELVEALRERILSGEFGRGGRLPSFRALAVKYATTQETMNKVMHRLQAEGWLLSLGPKGLFVTMPRVRFSGLTKNFYDYLKEQGMDASEEHLEEAKIIEAPVDIAESMKLAEKSLLIRRFRRYGTQNAIYRISEAYFPKSFVTDSMFAKIKEEPHYDLILEIKNQFGKVITDVHEEVIARFPTSYEQKLLKIVPANPVLDVKRTSFADNKQTAIFFAHIILNANHFVLSYDYPVEHWK